MPTLLHIDSSADLTHSRSRALTAAFADAWRALAGEAIADPPDGPPGAGLVATGGFPFAPGGADAPHWAGFGPGGLVVPEVALARRGHDVRMTVAVLAAPDDLPEDVIDAFVDDEFTDCVEAGVGDEMTEAGVEMTDFEVLDPSFGPSDAVEDVGHLPSEVGGDGSDDGAIGEAYAAAREGGDAHGQDGADGLPAVLGAEASGAAVAQDDELERPARANLAKAIAAHG